MKITGFNQKNIKSSLKDQLKIFFKNYDPVRVLLRLVYKITENNCHS